MEVLGMIVLRITDPETSKIRVCLANSENRSVQFQVRTSSRTPHYAMPSAPPLTPCPPPLTAYPHPMPSTPHSMTPQHVPLHVPLHQWLLHVPLHVQAVVIADMLPYHVELFPHRTCPLLCCAMSSSCQTSVHALPVAPFSCWVCSSRVALRHTMPVLSLSRTTSPAP